MPNSVCTEISRKQKFFSIGRRRPLPSFPPSLPLVWRRTDGRTTDTWQSQSQSLARSPLDPHCKERLHRPFLSLSLSGLRFGCADAVAVAVSAKDLISAIRLCRAELYSAATNRLAALRRYPSSFESRICPARTAICLRHTWWHGGLSSPLTGKLQLGLKNADL